MRYLIFTYNIDFHKTDAQESASLRSIADKADVCCIQEAKHLNVGHVLKDGFYTHQALRNDAKQGVALSWRKGKVHRKTNPPKSKTGTRHRGYVLGVLNLGFKMLPRYINYRDLVFNGVTVRVISTHRPPQRYKILWYLFDKALAAFVKRSPYPVIIGMDSNEENHSRFERMSGLVWRGIGIDGFYLSKSLVDNIVKGSLRKHPKAKSDHHPVSILLDF